MLFMPLNFLLNWLFGPLSIALMAEGGYLLYEWYWGELPDTGYLVIGLSLLGWSLVGGPLALLILRRPGADEPTARRDGEVRRLQRPDGSEIQVEFYGPPSAQPLVMIHGWGPDSTIWYYAKEQLSREFRVIVWDLPGLGLSKGPTNRDYSLEKFARDLEAVVGLADRPVVLLGHSIGGMIILTFCRLYRQQLGSKVAGLVLVNTTYTNPVRTTILHNLMQALQKPLLEPLLHLTILLWPLVWLMNWLSYLNGSMLLNMELSGFKGTETRGQLNFATLLSLRHSPAVLARGTLGMFGYDATAVLPTIDLPVLVIEGASDPATLPEASEQMHARLPNSRLVVLKPASHMSLLERNKEFGGAVATFMRQSAPPAGPSAS